MRAFVIVGSPSAHLTEAGVESVPDPPGTSEWRRRSWRSATGAVAALGWSLAEDDSDPRWEESDAGVTVLTGEPFAVGERSVQAALSRLLAPPAEAVRREATASLAGLYALAAVRSDGTGVIAADPMGLRFVYYGERAGRCAVGTRADLVAHALEPGPAAPALDAEAVCAVAHNTIRPPGRSGFVGVSVLEPGQAVELRAGGELALIGRQLSWLRHADDLDGLSADELIDLVHDDLRRNIAQVAATPLQVRIDLTGGKDSRLVLALLLEAGLAQGLPFKTIGDPALADVAIATDLAALYGLTHESGLPMYRLPRDYGDDVEAFVRYTGGIVGLGEARPLPSRQNAVLRVSGMNGEILRTHRTMAAGFDSIDPDGAMQVILPRSALGLARPDFARQLDDSLRAYALTATELSSSPYDWLDSFDLRIRARQRYGPLDDLQTAHRFPPLYSIAGLAAAFALGGDARQAELLHRSVMVRVAPDLAKMPFAGKDWHLPMLRRVQQRVALDLQLPAAPVADAPPAAAAREPTPGLYATMLGQLPDDRRAVLAALIGDRTNPAWAYLDRDAAESALARYEQIRPRQRRELLAACSAATWLRT